MLTVTETLLVVVLPWAALAWVTAVVCLFKAVANRKPGVRLWHDAPFGAHLPWWLRNPFNHVLSPGNLTEAGLKYRRWHFYAVLAFVVPILAVLSIAALTGELK